MCHHSSYRKVAEEKRKIGETKNSGCGAFIKISIKLDTQATRKNDVFVKVSAFSIYYSFEVVFMKFLTKIVCDENYALLQNYTLIY